MDKKRPCVEALTQGMSDSFTMYFRAHAYHWNVEGTDFSEYHKFFSAIYEDVYESIDLWAENIRKLNAMAPQSVAEVGMPSKIEDVVVGSDPMEMCVALYEANEVVIESINAAFQIATEINEQGIADFLAGRDNSHKKWRWQLNAITGLGNKSEEEEPMPMSDYPEGGVAYDVNDQPREDLIYFGDRAEKALSDRVARYNKKAPASLQASAQIVRAVYRRGALTASASESRDHMGMARVDAFLRLMSAGRPTNAMYTQDDDLLPVNHMRSDMFEEALVASAAISSLTISDINTVEKPEDYVLAMTELSGLGYDVEPAFRATWMRGVSDGNSRQRCMYLAVDKYDSQDADLLPTR